VTVLVILPLGEWRRHTPLGFHR